MGTVGSYLLREVDPFASCAADAAIFYAVSECGDQWWSEHVWEFATCGPHSPCVTWTGDIVANPAENGNVVGRPTVMVTKSGHSAGVYVRVHRLLWAWAYGYENLPDGRVTDFSTDEVIVLSCRNPLCVSVEHMEKITRTEMGNRIWTSQRAAAGSV